MSRCAHCGVPKIELSQCAGCKALSYCSRDHQKAHWPSHKALCKQITTIREKNLGFGKTVQKEGVAGDSPKEGAMCQMQYIGKLVDGTVFDQSSKPFEFKLAARQVIAGWDVGVKTMNKGEHATLVISPEMGYGKQGAGGAIPPNAFLVFEVILVDFTGSKTQGKPATTTFADSAKEKEKAPSSSTEESNKKAGDASAAAADTAGAATAGAGADNKQAESAASPKSGGKGKKGKK